MGRIMHSFEKNIIIFGTKIKSKLVSYFPFLPYDTEEQDEEKIFTSKRFPAGRIYLSRISLTELEKKFD